MKAQKPRPKTKFPATERILKAIEVFIRDEDKNWDHDEVRLVDGWQNEAVIKVKDLKAFRDEQAGRTQ